MNIVNGIIKDAYISGIKLKTNIITPSGKANARTLEAIKTPLYIVVHNTGNTSASAGDENHGTYLQNVEKADTTYLSWHFTVDADSITQHLPLTEHGWHAGDGSNGTGNRNGIGIEIAENANYTKCEANGILLIKALMAQFGIPISRVQPHRKFSSVKKLCPRRILKSEATWKSDWAAFQKRITAVTTSATTAGIIKVGDTVTVKSGSKTYEGKSLASWAANGKTQFKVLQLSGARAVIGNAKGEVTAAVNTANLTKA